MRKLKTSDIPAACRVAKALGLRDKLHDLSQRAEKTADVWEKGFDLLWDLFDAATEQHGELLIYSFLAGPLEMTPEEVADLELPTLLALLKQLAAENDLAAFFKSLQAWMR